MSIAHPPLATLSAERTREWLNDGQEVALLDLREAGQFGEGHPFFAIPLPYSRLELDARRLLPRLDVRVVLLDSGDGVAERGARRLQALGYTQVHVLQGGAPAWAAAGYTLFQGVNLPSKTFGELVEAHYHTPHISATELHRRQQAGEALVLLDGRTLAEHRKMTIPGAVSLPNGELAAHWARQVPDASTPVVVHCAGRTRSIIGAEILRHLGLPNPVLALENGTQGWALAGLTLEHGSQRQVQGPVNPDPAAQAAARRDAQAAGAPHLSVAQAQAWLDDAGRSTYVLDVRSEAEYRAGTLAGARHAPGGQLLQATDQSVAVRRSRVLLLDHEDVRAPVIAAWLRRMGYEAATVEGGIHAALTLRQAGDWAPPAGRRVTAHALPGWTSQHQPALIDVQASMAYRQQHAAGARWAVRPSLAQAAPPEPALPVLVLAPSAELAQLAAADLSEAGWTQVHWALQADWLAAGLPTEATPDSPSDAEAIDYLFFVHDRHDGNLEAARRYLAWETGLIAQCQPDELAGFQLD
ncbi:MAG: sulfurtransferase [Curvibacter lanceolatus]|uniref:rhodanese-like domain-containing protein n=1 Tax=Curvibacter lanceolatus TaxID=86182 RepID=UPI0003627578|nr:rhodanese-like domain-containing protein [Curvibacter lanceolatus]MBV5291837.1 sulfurtransferase [Curvibacter lanceolatus]